MRENVTDPIPCLLLQTVHLKQTRRLTPSAFEKVIYPLLTLYPGQSARHHRDYHHIGIIRELNGGAAEIVQCCAALNILINNPLKGWGGVSDGKSWNHTSGHILSGLSTHQRVETDQTSHTHTQSQQLNCPCLPVRYRSDPDTLTGKGNWQFTTCALVLDAESFVAAWLEMLGLSLRSLMKHMCVQICNCDKKPANIQRFLFSSGCLNFLKKKKENLCQSIWKWLQPSSSAPLPQLLHPCVSVCVCVCVSDLEIHLHSHLCFIWSWTCRADWFLVPVWAGARLHYLTA